MQGRLSAELHCITHFQGSCERHGPISWVNCPICWKLTIEFGRMYEKMQREWREYCVRELEDLQRIKGSLEQNAAAGAAGQEE